MDAASGGAQERAGESAGASIHAATISRLQELLGEKYSGIEHLSDGSTRTCFLARWGGQRRVIKVDKAPEGPRSERHVGRGYDTNHDVRVLASMPDPRAHHITQIFDHFPGVLVEEYFESRTLADIGRLSLDGFAKVFPQVLEGARYCIKERGIFHRDLKPSNILVAGNLETRITDFANAGTLADLTEKRLPTAGSHFILDPLLVAGFTGKEAKYSEQNEMYALGVDMLYALTGRYWLEYDPDAGTAVRLDREERTSLLEKGLVSYKLHDGALEDVLRRRLPRGARKYAHLIKRCMTLDSDLRYGSIDELVADFTATAAREESSRGFRKVVGWAAAGLALLGLAGGFMHRAYEQEVAQVRSQASMLAVTPMWDGETLTIDNNAVGLEVSMTSSASAGSQSYPYDTRVVHVEPGEPVYVGLLARERQIDRKRYAATFPTLAGKAYVEGFEGKEFSVFPKRHENTEPEPDSWMWRQGREVVTLELPKGAPAGTYMLAVELYAPTEKELRRQRDGAQESFDFPEGGVAIVRKRIPLIVGGAEPLDIQGFKMSGYSGQTDVFAVSPGRSGEMRDDGLVYDASLVKGERLVRAPGKDAGATHALLRFELPDLEREGAHTLRISAAPETGGDPVWSTFLPLERICTSCDGPYKSMPSYMWRLRLPDKTFSQDLIGYRRQMLAR